MTQAKRQPRITKAGVKRTDILSIAAAATAHPDTVIRALNGVPIRGDVGVRIADEVKRRGIG